MMTKMNWIHFANFFAYFLQFVIQSSAQTIFQTTQTCWRNVADGLKCS